MFSSLTVSRGACVALALIPAVMAARAEAACDNIVAVSRGWAEYMVLDPDTLSTLRVGDLRWLGIQSVNFVAKGSTFERSVLNSYDYLRTNSEDPVIDGFPGARWTTSAYTLLSLENMGEEVRSQGDIPIMDSGSIMLESYERIQWADWIQKGALIREIYDRDQHYVAAQELLAPDFSVMRRWEPRVAFNLQYPACAIGDRVYFAGRIGVHVFDDQGGTIYELEDLQNEGFRLVSPHTKNCKALAFSDTPDDDPMRAGLVVDIVTGTMGPEFSLRKYSEYVLYDDGRRLLQQTREGGIVDEGSRVYAYLGDHINQFSLIDATTGEVLLERQLQTGSGALSQKMLCDNESPRALVQEGNTMHLIDPNTLEITASRAMPEGWGSGYVIFE